MPEGKIPSENSPIMPTGKLLYVALLVGGFAVGYCYAKKKFGTTAVV